jgi:hypothetical protein
MSRAHMHKGASQQLTEKHQGARRGRTGPKQAWADRPRPAGLACFGPGSRPLWPRCLSIYCLCLRRPPHPSILQIAAETKEKYREEAGGRRKSSSCLGDGLGHALAAMVGPAWWSHGGVLEPRLEFIKSFVPSTFDDDINLFLSLLWSTTSLSHPKISNFWMWIERTTKQWFSHNFKIFPTFISFTGNIV